MAVEFEKPYSTDEISKRPFAVVISLLIGLLLMSVGWNLMSSKRIKDLTDKADEEKTKRIDMYERMIFYKGEKERLETEQTTSDSLVREKTQPFVNKLLSQNK